MNLQKSVTEELFRVVIRPVLSHVTFTPGEEVGTEQAVEINQDHDIHHYHAGEEEFSVVQPGVVVEDVPGEVGLGGQAERDVGEEVGELGDIVSGGGLSGSQLQQQPQVERHAVDLHEESHHSTGYVHISVEGVQEAPDHQRVME